ncbi:MAG: ribulose-phosphate 3-epimerase [Clostridia bacterium]|nr:ribulose-phosphate 3-epimerase [Clostridia bacterium]
MTEIKISPSLLSADWLKIGLEADKIYDIGADMIHCDVIDGIFAPNITFGMPMISALKRCSKLPLDVHLMIVEPERYIDKFIAAGSDTIAFHPEASKDPHGVLASIRAAGIKAGIAINPNVAVEIAREFIDEIDYILLMGVFPGFGGQKFIPYVMDKISLAKELIGDKSIYIELDGGVTVDNITRMKELGLDVAVAGNAVLAADNPKEAVKLLKKQ